MLCLVVTSMIQEDGEIAKKVLSTNIKIIQAWRVNHVMCFILFHLLKAG